MTRSIKEKLPIFFDFIKKLGGGRGFGGFLFSLFFLFLFFSRSEVEILSEKELVPQQSATAAQQIAKKANPRVY